LGDHLRTIVESGDVLQETGTTTGLTPNCKIGDFVVTIGSEKAAAGARIVIEAKESASYDLTKTLDEAATARVNRQAEFCIFVHSTKTAQPSIPNFERYGSDLVVKWDADDDENDNWLLAAFMVATRLAVRAASRGTEEAASFDKIDKAIERIRKHIDGCEDITNAARTAGAAADKIQNRARIMHEGLAAQLLTIIEETARLKDQSADE